ncbi:MAG TPA: queuosine salvage family protein [Candidatus Binataceae bacterium]|nr:queuosine salvage family protein [Candidatus Binataceae bacterium]
MSENSSFVRIDYERLSEHAQSLSSNDIALPKLDPNSHFLGHGEDTLAFILILDAINFGSGWFPHLKKRPAMSGYFTIASALRDTFESTGPLSADQIARISAADCARIFGQDSRNAHAQELMGKFAEAMNDFGRLILDRYNGKYASLIEDVGHSAEDLVRSLSAMTFFNDVELWRGQRIPFYKRAQLTAADLALAFDHKGLGHFRDLDQLTIFADNLVPHVLRLDEILLYDAELSERIDGEELIPAGSPEEIEIRACALHAVELLVEELRRRGRSASAMIIDHLLWNRGQLPEYKRAKPRHRTRTVFY